MLTINHRTQSLSELTLPCPLDRADLLAMDRALKSRNWSATTRQLLTSPTLRNFSTEKRQTASFTPSNLWELAPRHLPPNSSEPLVESIIEPLIVRIEGLGLAQPITWWTETDDSHDEWIWRFNNNVVEVLVPAIQAWKVGSQKIKQNQDKSLYHACRSQRAH
ncbi:hypothetical protein F4678DRAFT_460708 [Xylaria arbuscula]|nr:hypothetical protein F4678DRAFT_460708 [Xylaria arbuscula]